MFKLESAIVRNNDNSLGSLREMSYNYNNIFTNNGSWLGNYFDHYEFL